MANPYNQIANPGAPLAAFNTTAFAELVQNRGLVYRWSRALACTCRLRDDGDQPDPTCTKCAGDGWRYVNPCYREERHLPRDYTEVKAVMSSLAQNPTVQNQIGVWTMAEGLLTVDAGTHVGYRDRFVAVQQLMTHSQVLTRGAANVVPVGFHNLSNELRETAFRYEPVDVTYIEDNTDTIYFEGLDFKLTLINQVRKLEWLVGRGPAPGALYVVHYTCRPVWLVDDATYGIQHSTGPAKGLSGPTVKTDLPTTFKVALDFVTHER